MGKQRVGMTGVEGGGSIVIGLDMTNECHCRLCGTRVRLPTRTCEPLVPAILSSPGVSLLLLEEGRVDEGVRLNSAMSRQVVLLKRLHVDIPSVLYQPQISTRNSTHTTTTATNKQCSRSRQNTARGIRMIGLFITIPSRYPRIFINFFPFLSLL